MAGLGGLSEIPEEVVQNLGWYVYRLVDPRNGETFYVGKGTGQRLLQHLEGALVAKGEDLKSQRIKEIHEVGLEVGHVVHRHGIADDKTAYLIEAALMDAYPGLHNLAKGHGSGEHGSRHLMQIIHQYATEDFVADRPLLLISIRLSFGQDLSIYDAVRHAWKVSLSRVAGIDLVLSHRRGIVNGVFRPLRWMEATRANFPEFRERPGRHGFVGEAADPETTARYLRKRVPQVYRPPGAANPVRFVTPEPVAA